MDEVKEDEGRGRTKEERLGNDGYTQCRGESKVLMMFCGLTTA